MKSFNLASFPKSYKDSVIAIGNFDGVHRGHQKVFNEAKKFSKKKKIKFGVLTFTPPPVMFFNKKVINYKLTSEVQKFKLFKKNGVDFVVKIKFDKKFSKFLNKNIPLKKFGSTHNVADLTTYLASKNLNLLLDQFLWWMEDKQGKYNLVWN